MIKMKWYVACRTAIPKCITKFIAEKSLYFCTFLKIRSYSNKNYFTSLLRKESIALVSCHKLIAKIMQRVRAHARVKWWPRAHPPNRCGWPWSTSSVFTPPTYKRYSVAIRALPIWVTVRPGTPCVLPAPPAPFPAFAAAAVILCKLEMLGSRRIYFRNGREWGQSLRLPSSF